MKNTLITAFTLLITNLSLASAWHCKDLNDPITEINGYKLSAPAVEFCYNIGGSSMSSSNLFGDILVLNTERYSVAKFLGDIKTNNDDFFNFEMNSAEFYKVTDNKLEKTFSASIDYGDDPKAVLKNNFQVKL